MATRRQRSARTPGGADFLDELLEAGEADSPGFKNRVEATYRWRVFTRRLAAQRKGRDLSQRDVAKLMGSTQRIVSKIESGGDVQISTLARYVEAIGLNLQLGAAVGKRKAS